MNSAERTDIPGRWEPLDTPTLDAVIARLLGADPPPHVMALSEVGLRIGLPPAIPVAPGHAIGGIASPPELCVPGDMGLVVEAWERARQRRGSQVVVHLRHDSERSVNLHFVDARHQYGVYLGIVVGTFGAIDVQATTSEYFGPRSCTMQRNEVSVICSVDPAITQILGWTADELVGMRSLELLHPDDHALAIANWMEMLARPGGDQRVLMRYRRRDGEYIWFENTHRNLLNDPACGRVLTEMVDVSERMKAVDALRANEQLLRRLTETLPLGIAQIDTGRQIVYRNERLLEIMGVEQADSIDALFARVAYLDRPALKTAVLVAFAGGQTDDVELTVDHRSGPRRCTLAMRALESARGTVSGVIVCLTDCTESVRLRNELERRAKYDPLTQCHNRVSIFEALDALLGQPEQRSRGVAVLFIDLDRFKQINDRFGHAAGDELLRLTGQRLLASVRAGELVGRIGGDEFLVICPDVADPATAVEIAQRIDALLAQQVVLGSSSVAANSSIGVAWTDCAVDSDAFVANADEAMYASKRSACGPVLAG